jgi:hypothetical protein
MPFCTKCGEKVSGLAKSCGKCGNAVQSGASARNSKRKPWGAVIGALAAVIAVTIGTTAINIKDRKNDTIDLIYCAMQAISLTDDVVQNILYMDRLYWNLALFQDSAGAAGYQKEFDEINAKMNELYNIELPRLVYTEAAMYHLREAWPSFERYRGTGKEFAALAGNARTKAPEAVYDSLRSFARARDAAGQSAADLREMAQSLAKRTNDEAKRGFRIIGNKNTLKAINRSVLGVNAAGEIAQGISDIDRAYRYLIIFKDSASAADYTEALEDSRNFLDIAFTRAEKAFQTGAEKAKLEEIKEKFNRYNDKGKELAALAKDTKIDMPRETYDALKDLARENAAAELVAHAFRIQTDSALLDQIVYLWQKFDR